MQMINSLRNLIVITRASGAIRSTHFWRNSTSVATKTEADTESSNACLCFLITRLYLQIHCACSKSRERPFERICHICQETTPHWSWRLRILLTVFFLLSSILCFIPKDFSCRICNSQNHFSSARVPTYYVFIIAISASEKFVIYSMFEFVFFLLVLISISSLFALWFMVLSFIVNILQYLFIWVSQIVFTKW